MADLFYPIRLALGFGIVSMSKAYGMALGLYWTTYAYIWDILLVIDNNISAPRPGNAVIPRGKPGYLGDWGLYPYQEPTERDSRSPCPALNALANHGIIPRDGRMIKFTDFAMVLESTYNLSPSLCLNILQAIAKLFHKDYFKDSISLGDFNAHNVIEHDASIVRHDAFFQPDQAKPAHDLIKQLLASATGEQRLGKGQTRVLTPEDIGDFTRKRRIDCKSSNPQYTLKFIHQFFSGNNNAILYETTGGRVDDLDVFLHEERFPSHWQPRVRAKHGLTLMALNLRTIQLMIYSDPPPFVYIPRKPLYN